MSAVNDLKQAMEIIRLTAKGEEPCSRAKDSGHPGANWVTEQNGLPPYICNISKHMPGTTTSVQIAEAVSTIKRWIADPKTSAETKAKATAAIAQWDKMKAGAKAHHTVKEAAKKVK